MAWNGVNSTIIGHNQNTHHNASTSSGSTIINTGTNNQNNAASELSIESNLHPLYLHNNDHPGLVLISKKLLGFENYNPWKRSMKIALSAKKSCPL